MRGAWGVLGLAACGRLGFSPLASDSGRGDGLGTGDGHGTGDGLGTMADASGAYASAFARWTFDEGSGPSAFDATGHGRRLDLVGPLTEVPGKFGDAVHSAGATAMSQYLV